MPKTTRTGPKSGAGRSPVGAAKKTVTAAQAAPTADVLVELPGGTARITIQATAGVRRAARDWLRLVETLARASLSPPSCVSSYPRNRSGSS